LSGAIFASVFFRERTDAPNDLAGSSAVPDDSLEGGVRFREIGLLVIEPA